MEQNLLVTPASLAELLHLELVGPDRFQSVCSERNRGGEIFGGQYLGQSLRAVMETAPEFTPQAMFCFFLRAASASLPLEFSVERTRHGRRLAHRRVTVTQEGREVFRAEIALHVPDSGHPSHTRAMPDVPGPEGLRPWVELLRENVAHVGEGVLARMEGNRMSEVRPVDPEAGVVRRGERPAARIWVRGLVPDDAAPSLQYAALAYLSDFMAPFASRLIHADRPMGGVTALSLSHTVSFHALPKVQDWLLFDLSSQFAGGGIGSNRNLIHGRDGQLVASVTQDAMVRNV